MYHDDELPTRPDLPNTAATKCRHCGHVYGDHRIARGASSLLAWPLMAQAGCVGLRRNFDPEGNGNVERA